MPQKGIGMSNQNKPFYRHQHKQTNRRNERATNRNKPPEEEWRIDVVDILPK